MASLIQPVTSTAEFDAAVKAGVKAVAFFWASWSAPCKHMAQVLEALAQQHSGITYLKVEAEEVDDVTEKFGVTTVPYFVLLQDGKVTDQLEGADAAGLTTKVAALAAAAAAAPSATPAAAAAAAAAPAAAAVPTAAQPQDVTARIKQLLASAPVVLFMKGSAAAPYCGFSRRVVEALHGVGVGSFTDVDIFQDEELRQALKEYSNWPTYPQLYVAGELVGGCDIVGEMAQSGELLQLLQEKAPAALQSAAPQQQQKQAPAAAPPAAAAAPAAMTEQQREQLKQLTMKEPVMVFMKGTPEGPRCGFSRKVVEALSSAGLAFGSFDILSDESVRQGLKQYSQWPTYPQVYVQGELLGGCDIVLEMAGTGELKLNVEEMMHRMQATD
uniref:Thioredoxin domain-containing protein n=1 Tax=Tetradesmus obliquus TaxID=3088 RepID=A0A383VCP1_TETOB|eukprot:jgi/Sobl393_1/12850/SZX63335.1